MSPLLLFILGVLVFLVTVYGTVVVGGLLLTERLLSDDASSDSESPEAVVGRSSNKWSAKVTRRLLPADY